MNERLLKFCLLSFFLMCLVSSERGECKLINMYYSYTDPGSIRPKPNPNCPPPWVQIDNQVGVGILPNQTVWFGADNWYCATNKTDWVLVFAGSAAHKLVLAPGSRAYMDGSPPTTNPPITITYPYVDVGAERHFHWQFSPQPDWQVGVVKKVAKGEGDDTDSILVAGGQFCYNTVVSSPSVVIANSWFGLVGADSPAIAEIIVFADGVSVDSTKPQVLTASGTWEREFVATDPYGQPRPMGVKWTSSGGTDIQAGEVFSLEVTTAGEAPGTYSLYAFDSESGVYLPFMIHSESADIPTLTEWGMIIFVVLLAGWMTFVVVRRWRASHATA